MSIRNKTKIYNDWNECFIIDKYNLTIKGHSRGSEKTGFYIPQLKLFFDAGIQSYFEPKYIFITHCHTDHSFALPMILTGISTTPSIYVPNEHVELFKNFVNATYQLSTGDSSMISQYPIIGAKINDIIKLQNNYSVKVYELYHSVPTRGYGLIRNIDKLKPEYLHLTKDEIIKLKNQKIEITHKVYEKILSYLTDTTIDVFNNKEILEYPNIMVECTFLYEEEQLKPDRGRHITWNQLKPIVIQNPNITFMLIHFSMRYSNEDLITFFNEQDIFNVKIII